MNFSDNREKIYERLKKKTKNSLCYNTYVQITDNETAVIENCKHIVECNEIMVKVQTNDFIVEVWGNGLSINGYNTENVTVNGEITTVNIARRGRK